MIWHFPASAHVAAKPEAIAFCVDGAAISWATLERETKGRAAAWRELTTPEAIVGLVAERSLDVLFDLVGLIRAGRQVALLNPQATAEEQARAIQSIEATVLAEDLRSAVNERSAQPTPPEFEDAPWALDRILARILTSGTTGQPKPVTLSAEQVISSTLAGASRLGSLPSDVWHSPRPWHHVGGLMVILRALILGFQGDLWSHFDANISRERLSKGDVQLASFVPVMLERVLEGVEGNPFPSLRALLIGGAATPPSLLERAKAMQLPIARSWGMSESASQIATAIPGEFETPLAPLPFVKISHENDVLVLEGPQILGGRRVTSDRGTIRERGVEILGRADDVFISGGENIDPAEIETVLRSHIAVSDALVVGIANQEWGQRPVAFVRLCGEVTSDALRAFTAGSLQRYKVPDQIFFVDDLPRNAMGKPDRRAARTLAEANNFIQASASEKPESEKQGAKA